MCGTAYCEPKNGSVGYLGPADETAVRKKVFFVLWTAAFLAGECFKVSEQVGSELFIIFPVHFRVLELHYRLH